MEVEDENFLTIRNQLLACKTSEELLSTISDIDMRGDVCRRILRSLVVELHNSSQLDIIATYTDLKNPPLNGGDFFLLRHAFEEIISDLSGNTSEMMQCVMHLTKEAGNDLSSGALLPHLTDWYIGDKKRLNEAFGLLASDHETYGSLMPQIIEAGSQSDPDKYINYCTKLMEGDDIELRRKAIFSVGRISFSEIPNFTKPCASAIAASVKQNDDRLRATALKTLFHICRSDASILPDTLEIIEFLMADPEEYTLHAAAELFAWEFRDIPESIMVTLLEKLQRTPALNSGTWNFIDQGINKLINTKQREVALAFLEELSINVPDLDLFETFQSTHYSVLKDPKLTSKITTRWLLKGHGGLKNFVAKMLLHVPSTSPVYADMDEFDPKNPIHVIFLARKAIGYFFLDKASSATYFILSLMKATSSKEALKALSELLEDPLLLNYPDDVRRLLETPSVELTSEARRHISTALKNSEKYYKALRKVGDLPEVHVPQSEQESHMKSMASKTQKAMNEEENKSVLLSAVSKSVILHGNKAAFTFTDLNGNRQRSEISMQSHSHSATVPRMAILTPYDFEIMLRVFRAERISQ